MVRVRAAFLTVLILAQTILWSGLPTGDAGPSMMDPTLLDRAVSYAVGRVSAIGMPGPGPHPPLGASSLIREYLESGGDLGTTRANPIPSNWDLKATTAHSKIYVATGQFVQQSDIDAIASTFESKIYPNVTDWFHPVSPPASINIYIYDMGDGAGGVGGFFIPSPMTRNDLYVDLQDLRYSQSWSFEIVAHEFQHLLHYDLDPNEDIWLNEGMADLAVRVSLGPGTSGIQSHIDVYESLPVNDLLTWDEGQPPDYLGTIADYGRAYAFISYLVDHFGGKDLVRAILSDGRNSVDSIDRQLESRGYGERMWDVVAREKVANLIDDPSYGAGLYDQGLIDIRISNMFSTTSSYPYKVTIGPTVRYSGYYVKLTKGNEQLGLIVNSTRTYHAAVLGTLGGTPVWSTNLSGAPSVPTFVQLSRFGELYDTVFVIPHTSVKDATMVIEVLRQQLTPPVTDVLISPGAPDGENGFYLTAPAILLTTREGSVVMYAWNDGPFSQVTGSFSAPEGTNVLRFYSTGPLYLSEPERNLTFKVDTQDPMTSSTIDPPTPNGLDGFYITSPTVVLSAGYPGDRVFYDIGNGIVEYDGPFDLPSGLWTVRYWGVDDSGRRERERSFEVKVDLSDPSVEIAIYPGSPNGKLGYYTERPLVNLLSESGVSIFYSLSGNSYRLYSGPFELEDGVWDIMFYGESISGRMSSILTRSVRVDATPPDVKVTFDPPLKSGWNKENILMNLELDREGDRAFFMLGDQGPFLYTGPYLLTDGTYDITYWAEDDAGNTAPRSSVSVMVDVTTPVTRILFDREPDNNIWFYDRAPIIDFMPSFPPVSEETTYYSVEGGPFKEFRGEGIELGPGISTLEYYSVDLAGNTETVRRWEIGLDLERPEPSVKANRTLIPVRGPVRFDLSGSADDNGIYRYWFDPGDGSEPVWTYDSRMVHHYGSLGRYKVSVEVEDRSGRRSSRTATVTIEVVTQEEYDRMTSPDIIPTIIAVTASLLVLLAVLGTAVFVLLRIRAHSDGPAPEVVFELDPDQG